MKPGGVFAFSDWIARESLSDDELPELREKWSFPSLLSISEYAGLLATAGFTVITAEDITDTRSRSVAQPADQGEWEAAFAERFGADELVRQESRITVWRDLLTSGKTGYGVFVAKRKESG